MHEDFNSRGIVTHILDSLRYEQGRTWHMQDRFSIDREEFQDFLAENKRLVERYKKLLDELDRLQSQRGSRGEVASCREKDWFT